MTPRSCRDDPRTRGVRASRARISTTEAGPRARRLRRAPEISRRHCANGMASLSGTPCFSSFILRFKGAPDCFWTIIFVRPAFRKHGIGTALIKHVAGIAWREKYFCMRWEVLDWNKQAIDFYNNLGAAFLEEWKPVDPHRRRPRSSGQGDRVSPFLSPLRSTHSLSFTHSPAIFSRAQTSSLVDGQGSEHNTGSWLSKTSGSPRRSAGNRAGCAISFAGASPMSPMRKTFCKTSSTNSSKPTG